MTELAVLTPPEIVHVNPPKDSEPTEIPIERIDNERDNPDVPILKPFLSPFEEKFPDGSINPHPVERNAALEDTFEYLSRTRGLEVGTIKTEYLQQIADKMIAGTDTAVRVVVMKKGDSPSAFCCGDGTLFLSQSLINQLDSVDEIAGVIAHELGHIRNHTHENASGLNSFGTGWFHESISDAGAPPLLEKAHLNSFAFAEAIEKVSGIKRGTIHQGGKMRASQSVAQHLGRNYRTSNKDHTPKPDILDGEVETTNLELFMQALKKNNIQRANEISYKLHVKDLLSAREQLSELTNQEITLTTISEDPEKVELKRDIELQLKGMLEEKGADQYLQEAILLATTVRDYKETRRYTHLSKPEEIVTLFNEICDIQRLTEASNLTREIMPDKASEPYRMFLEICAATRDNIFNPEATPQALGIPLNDDALCSILEDIKHFSDSQNLSDFYLRDIQQSLSYLVCEYVKRSAARKVTDSSTPVYTTTHMKSLFGRIQAMGLFTHLRTKDNPFYDLRDGFLDHNGTNYQSSSIPRHIIVETFADYFLKKDDTAFGIKDIDELFHVIENQGETAYGYNLDLDKLVGWTAHCFDENRASDEEKVAYAKHIMSFASTHPDFTRTYAPARYEWGWNETEEEKAQHDQQALLYFGIDLATKIFKDDSDGFYSFLDSVMEHYPGSGIRGSDLLAYSKPLVTPDYRAANNPKDSAQYASMDKFTISQFDKFSQIPLIQDLLTKGEIPTYESLSQLAERLHNDSRIRSQSREGTIFSDELAAVVLGREYRAGLTTLLSQDVTSEGYKNLFGLVKTIYPEGPERTVFLREITKKVLLAPDLPFNERSDYLFKNFDEIGPEGLILLANEIEDIETFKAFRTKFSIKMDDYISGKSSATTKVAVVDVVTQFFSRNFEELFETNKSDEVSKREQSTKFAERWMDHFVSSGGFTGVKYDFTSGKFELSAKGREEFRTIYELMGSLKNLSPSQRFATAQKALLEDNGAFSSEENRKIMARQLIESLNVNNPFVKAALETVCRTGDAKFLSIPAAQMIARLLFNSLDPQAVDRIPLLAKKYYIPGGKLAQAIDLPNSNYMRSIDHTRRDLSVFGVQYRKYPDALITHLVNESDQQYTEITRRLHEILDPQEKDTETSDHSSSLNPEAEAIIKGVEGTGALGVRSIQLSAQMVTDFSPEVRKRLASSFDSNPGLNKLLFWENLYKLSQESAEHALFIDKLQVKGYLGGGSLYTTYEAIYTEDGQEKRIALKMLNPNTAAFLNTSYNTATKTLDSIIDAGSTQTEQGFQPPLQYHPDFAMNISLDKYPANVRKQARKGRTVVNLSNQWCIKDVNDPSFAEDDDMFEGTVETYNDIANRTAFTKPKRLFTSYELKAEDLADGRTLNKVLQDESVPAEQKKKYIQQMNEFMTVQLKKRYEENGKQFALVHSDPHVGNYIVEESKDGQPIAVIDRHMYLKLFDQDITVLEHLIKGKDRAFLGAMINRVIDFNKVARGVDKPLASQKIQLEVLKAYATQKVTGQNDSFGLLTTMFESFAQQNLEVPLELQLMIRNIQALKNINSEYGISLANTYDAFIPQAA